MTFSGINFKVSMYDQCDGVLLFDDTTISHGRTVHNGPTGKNVWKLRKEDLPATLSDQSSRSIDDVDLVAML